MIENKEVIAAYSFLKYADDDEGYAIRAFKYLAENPIPLKSLIGQLSLYTGASPLCRVIECNSFSSAGIPTHALAYAVNARKSSAGYWDIPAAVFSLHSRQIRKARASNLCEALKMLQGFAFNEVEEIRADFHA